MKRIIDHYNPRITVIDALPNHHNARHLAMNRHNVYINYYSGNNKLERKYWDKDMDKKEIKVPRTDLLDKTASEWHIGNVIIEKSNRC